MNKEKRKGKMILIVFLMVFSLIPILFVACTPSKNNLEKLGDIVSPAIYAGEAKRGDYSIFPTKMDSRGLELGTEFLLKGKNSINVGELEKELTIFPSFEYDLKETDEGVLISPKEDLKENTVYTINIGSNNWTYQTSSTFALYGVMPADKATQVPLDTGIEFIFSHTGVKPNDYIEIEPSTNGRFETYGNRLVFLPKKALKEGTVYKVKVKKGLPLEGSKEKLNKDYTFEFETMIKGGPAWKNERDPVYLSYNQVINEFSTYKNPVFEIDFYSNNDKASNLPIESKVYRYRNEKDYVVALDKLLFPKDLWTNYQEQETYLKTDGLEEVYSYKTDLIKNDNYYQELPQTMEEGFYLIDSRAYGTRFQALFQVTDISYYYETTDKNSIIWLNDLETKKSMGQANLNLYKLSEDAGKKLSLEGQIKTNSDGFAIIDKNRDRDKRVILVEKNNKKALILPFIINNRNYFQEEYAHKWNYFKIDRPLYKPKDQVEFFGFVKNRLNDKEELPEKLKVEISERSWYFYDPVDWLNRDDELIYVSKEVDLKGNFYEGKLDIENLLPGTYEIKVKDKNKIISNTYFQVDNYLKPAIKLEIEADNKAVFVDQPIKLTYKSKFYEGTPASRLDLNYNITGPSSGESKKVVTDDKGNYEMVYKAKYVKDQGIYATYNAYASLSMPSLAEVVGRHSFLVFFNNIDIECEGKIEGDRAILNGDIYNISLDRLNNGTAKNNMDYRDKPLEGHNLSLKIYRNEWKKRPSHREYDYINKKVIQKYEWYNDKKQVDRLNLRTNAKGEFQYSFPYKEEDRVYYTADISAKDLNERPVKLTRYFIVNNRKDPYYYDDSYPKISLNKEKYLIDDDIEARVIREGKPIKERVLFTIGQMGLIGAKLPNSPIYKDTFKESYAPNIILTAVAFTGEGYEYIGKESIEFDYDTKNLKLEVKADKEKYRPGDEVKLEVRVREAQSGRPLKGGFVNLALVDEALLTLADQRDNVLASLYSNFSDGSIGRYLSHGRNYIYRPYRIVSADLNKEEARPDEAGEINVRKDFLDTALFETISLDDEGKAFTSLIVPDNITSWRLMMVAISDKLLAGSDIANIKVSLPFFINSSHSPFYLKGDKPYINVSSYGSEIKEKDKIHYRLYLDDKLIDEIRGASPYQTYNLYLGEIDKEGVNRFKVTALTESGLSDGIEQDFNVLASYHEELKLDLYKAKKGLKLKNNSSGDVGITILSQGVGKYYHSLLSLSNSYGNRVDQRYLKEIARDLIASLEGKERGDYGLTIGDYLKEDGGISDLIYSESDLITTVNMLPLLLKQDGIVSYGDRINRNKMTLYLWQKYYSSINQNKAASLYGLSLLGEPVLNQVNAYISLEGLTMDDYIYLAMAYASLNDDYMAKEVYNKHIEGHVELYDDIAHLNVEDKKDKHIFDKNYIRTAKLMVLNQKIAPELGEKMYNYVDRKGSKVECPNSLKLTYIMRDMLGKEKTKSSISYRFNGKDFTLDLNRGERYISLPSSMLDKFEITDFVGDLDIALVYSSKNKADIGQDKNLNLKRSYYRLQDGKKTKKFELGDIVKVTLECKLSKGAIDDYYQVVDYLPSGLKAISNKQAIMGVERNHWSSYDIDGQKVIFYLSKWSDLDKPLVYYARIVSPGEYKAESGMIQGINYYDSRYLTENDKISIKH